ncbi:transcriptional regulator XRE family [Clostridium sp. CAG:306]|nr:transcriptional regulator XRE family [Clostridium sp. CAG:306]
MNLKKDFGLRLKELRNKSGITQYQLAEITGIDPKHISHIETGRSFPKADLIEKFAKALGIDYTDLFQTQYLKSKKEMISFIVSDLKKASDSDVKVVYKFVKTFLH